jgi:hypothetical protein
MCVEGRIVREFTEPAPDPLFVPEPVVREIVEVRLDAATIDGRLAFAEVAPV